MDGVHMFSLEWESHFGFIYITWRGRNEMDKHITLLVLMEIQQIDIQTVSLMEFYRELFILFHLYKL